MRVLLFANTDWYLYNFRLSLVERIVARGDQVVLVSPPGDYGARLRARGLDWRTVSLARRSIDPFKEIAALIALIRIYRSVRPDVVHHFTLECILLGSLAARFAGVSAVVNAIAGLGSIFTGGSRRARMLRAPVGFLLKRAFRRSEAIFQNPENLDALVGAGIVARSRSHLIRGSGVSTQRFTPGVRSLAVGVGKVLFASRLLKAKGVSDFVDAARRLKVRLPDVSFLLAGTSDVGSPEAIASSEIERWRSEGLVDFLGQREDMPELLADVDLLVLPTYYGEGVPRILIEAAASGLALVATDVPGCREIVRHEENGLLVRPRDPVEVAAAIERLMLDPVGRQRMGARGRAIACSEFSEDQVIRETLDVYSVVLRISC